MLTNESSSTSVELPHKMENDKRQTWREKMSDRTFSLDESDAPSTLECRIDHIPFYSWIESKLIQIRETFSQRGLDDRTIEDKEENLVEQFKTSLQNLIDVEIKENEQLQSRIRAIFDECSNLNRLLTLDHTVEKITNENLPLLEQLKRANELLDKINEVLRKKLDEIQQLKFIEENLCQKLNEKAIEFDENASQNLDELTYDQREEILSKHIENLRNLENERSSTIERCREEIHRMKSELELNETFNQPGENVDLLKLLNEPANSIELSQTNVDRLENFAQELDQIYETNRNQGEILTQTLRSLYERLNLNENEKLLKLPMENSHRPSNLLLLNEEIERCKDLRRQNMKTYIENIRDEIFAFYERCFYGREQMESFLPLYSNDFTEDLLEEHEKELQDIQIYYVHNQSLFENLANWHEIWAEYREFQRHASDPDRFKRRGYSAVQEEKQRKTLEFSLKKLQDAVLQLSKDYENEFGHQFLVEGVPVNEFFHHEKENYSQEKELEKARKQLARGQTPTLNHAQSNIKRLEMSSKTPGRQQTNLGKEAEIKPSTPFRPVAAVPKR